MVWVESPTNPTLQVVDIAAVCKIAHTHENVFVVCDNTFATPYFQRPLDLGADLVLHSITKYMNGQLLSCLLLLYIDRKSTVQVA